MEQALACPWQFRPADIQERGGLFLLSCLTTLVRAGHCWCCQRQETCDSATRLRADVQQSSSPAYVCQLSEVVDVQRVDLKPYCIELEVKDKLIYFAFRNDEEVYGWMEDIYSRSPLMGVSEPTNFVHQVHVGFDPDTGGFTVSSSLLVSLALLICRASRRNGQNCSRPRLSPRKRQLGTPKLSLTCSSFTRASRLALSPATTRRYRSRRYHLQGGVRPAQQLDSRASVSQASKCKRGLFRLQRPSHPKGPRDHCRHNHQPLDHPDKTPNSML